MGRLEGKTAIVTGGAGGIGQKTAELFLSEGANVALVDLNQDALTQFKSDSPHSDRLLIVEADVTTEDDVAGYVQTTQDAFNSVDILFNNAGIIGDIAPIVDQSLENFNKVIGVNATGIFLGLKHVLPVMTKQGHGSVINTSSVDGLRGSPTLSPYATSKHAVVGLTKTAALEVAPDNVRVNSIHPAPVSGDMMETVHEGVDPDTIMGAIPFNRYAQSEDISRMVLFLASDDSTFITGSQYRVDGGMGATS